MHAETQHLLEQSVVTALNWKVWCLHVLSMYCFTCQVVNLPILFEEYCVQVRPLPLKNFLYLQMKEAVKV